MWPGLGLGGENAAQYARCQPISPHRRTPATDKPNATPGQEIIEFYAMRMNIAQRLAEAIRFFSLDTLARRGPAERRPRRGPFGPGPPICAALRRRLPATPPPIPRTLQRRLLSTSG